MNLDTTPDRIKTKRNGGSRSFYSQEVKAPFSAVRELSFNVKQEVAHYLFPVSQTLTAASCFLLVKPSASSSASSCRHPGEFPVPPLLSDGVLIMLLNATALLSGAWCRPSEGSWARCGITCGPSCAARPSMPCSVRRNLRWRSRWT